MIALDFGIINGDMMNKREMKILFRQEKFILELLNCNFTKKEIAEKLNISLHSINSYISKFEKLGIWKKDFL